MKKRFLLLVSFFAHYTFASDSQTSIISAASSFEGYSKSFSVQSITPESPSSYILTVLYKERHTSLDKAHGHAAMEKWRIDAETKKKLTESQATNNQSTILEILQRLSNTSTIISSETLEDWACTPW